MQLNTLTEAAERITRGQRLLLAGDERLLAALPRGEWIGGTIPYFMSEAGGLMTRDRLFVTELPACVERIAVRSYDENEITEVYRHGFENGFSMIILPAGSAVHERFAVAAPLCPEFALRPLAGWVAGVHVADIGKARAKVYSGFDGHSFTDRAVVMHVALPRNKAAELGIVNLFEQDQGDAITFPETGFVVGDALINGEKRNFAEYVSAKQLDVRLPLVADYYGASINVSFQSVDAVAGKVALYAPVFAGITYRYARPVGDYAAEFMARLPDASRAIFSCNCILNYLYSQLEGRKTGPFTGPITFGEVAYQLLNQTLVYIDLVDIG